MGKRTLWVLVDVYINVPPKSFGLFYTHVYPKQSLQDAGGVLRKYNNKDISYQKIDWRPDSFR